jgi:3D (Asp-Asp-Asp) domain-containing protein
MIPTAGVAALLVMSVTPPAPPAPPGVLLSVTAYCWTGSPMANGRYPQAGDAAGDRWPLGTRLAVPGVGVVTVTDRIGWGSDLDLYMGRGGCEQRALTFGRRELEVRTI